MKVLYLDQSGQLGGGEIALLPWLCKQSDSALVVLFEDGPFRERLQQEGVPVQIRPTGDLNRVRREAGWRSALRGLPILLRTCWTLRPLSRNFDILYANSMKALFVAALIRRRRQPLVWHLRDILSADHFSALLRFAVVKVANGFASVVIANSKATASAFVLAGGRAESVSVVYDGVCAATFTNVNADAIELLREEVAPGQKFLIGVFSRLSAWKGQHIVLDAISTLSQVHLLIVGDALFGEQEYAASLRARASEPDLLNRVTFLGFRKDVATLMQSVDIVIHSSTAPEPFGLVIVEGMLAGKAVIATDAGGATEIIESEKTGILVAPGSVAAMREAILQLINDPDTMESLGEVGRLHATNSFPMNAMFEGISNVLRRLESGSNLGAAQNVFGGFKP